MLCTDPDALHSARSPRAMRSAAAALALALLSTACGGDREQEVVAAELGCEVKVSLPASSIGKAQKTLGLKDAKGEARTIWFYDTAALELFDKGIILRSRHSAGGPDDTTVKLRPMDARTADPSWSSVQGFKCEQDRTAQHTVTSCSLTRDAQRGAIDLAAKGPPAIAELFDGDQKRFLGEYAPLTIDWASLRALGPIDSRAWKFDAGPLDRKLSAERWLLPDGTQLFEVSTRVPASEADAMQGELERYLATLDLAADAAGATKTRTALEQLARR